MIRWKNVVIWYLKGGPLEASTGSLSIAICCLKRVFAFLNSENNAPILLLFKAHRH